MAFPTWTALEINSENHQGLAPLGLEPVGLSLARQLLPGITNATVHVRYFSFFSWVFWTFQQQVLKYPRRYTANDQEHWRIKLENVLRTATLSRYPHLKGVIGVTEAFRMEGLRPDQRVPIDSDRPDTAFKPASYSASFHILRCGDWDGEKVLLTEIGDRLGRAYDQELLATRGGATALETILNAGKNVPAAAIQTIAEAMALRPVRAHSPEHETLVELLFRLQPHMPGDPSAGAEDRRSRCLGLLLDLVRQSDGRLKRSWDLHRVFGSDRFEDGRHVEIAPEFEAEFQIWRRYQERQYQKVALYGFWEELNLFLNATSTHAASVGEIFRHFKLLVENSAVLSEWLGGGSTQLTVSEAQARLDRRLSKHSRQVLDDELCDLVRDSDNARERVGAGLLLLLLMVSEWGRRATAVPLWLRNWPQLTNHERLALSAFTQLTEARLEESLEEYLYWLIERCILDQANLVAFEKLSRGDYRFFVLRGENGYRVVKKQDTEGYLEYDQPRMHSAFLLMKDLGIVSLNGALSLTKLGERLLDRVRARHKQT